MTRNEPTHSPNFSEDEFSRALRDRIDAGHGPAGDDGGPDATLFTAVSRRRRARAAVASSLSVVLLLGIGGVAWRVADNLGNPGPAPTQIAAPPVSTAVTCDTSVADLTQADTSVAGYTLDDFAVGVDGALTAVVTGPDGENWPIDNDEVFAKLDSSEALLSFHKDDLAAVWAQHSTSPSADGTIAATEPVLLTSGGTAQDDAAPDAIESHEYQRWSVAGEGSSSVNECSTADSLASPAASMGDVPPAGAYVVFAHLPVTVTVGGKPRTVLLHSQTAVVVEVSFDGQVSVVSLEESVPRAQVSVREDDADSPQGLDTDKMLPEIRRADGTDLAFDYHDVYLNEAVTATSPDWFEADPGPIVNDARLVFPVTADVWTAATDHHIGVWSSDLGFTPGPTTDSLVGSTESRIVSSVVLNGDRDPILLWVESDSDGELHWIFAADLNDLEPYLVASPEELDLSAIPQDASSGPEGGIDAVSLVKVPRVAAFDGQVYWEREDVDSVGNIRRSIHTRKVDGTGAIREVATHLTGLVAGPAGAYAVQLQEGAAEPAATGTELATGVVKLTATGTEPYLELPTTPQNVRLQVARDQVAVMFDGATYLVETERHDDIVWVLAEEAQTTVLTRNGYLFLRIAEGDLAGTYATSPHDKRFMRIGSLPFDCPDAGDCPDEPAPELLSLDGAWAWDGGAIAWIGASGLAEAGLSGDSGLTTWSLTTLTNEVG